MDDRLVTTPMRNRVDLHTHTARSDGVLPPLELYEQMRAWGSTLVAITDHDTLGGVRELLAAGRGKPVPGGHAAPELAWPGPALIVGVEINTQVDAPVRQVATEVAETAELHILGLGVDPDDARFEALLAEQRAGRHRRLEETLVRLDGLGMPVREHLPQVPGGIEALGRPHVARALVACGHADSVEDAFARYLSAGNPAYVRRMGMGPRAAIEAVRQAGGLPVLAHSRWAPEEEPLIGLLQDWGLAGLEVHYPGWDEGTIEAVSAFASARGLIATGGSDYHGERSGRTNPLGHPPVPMSAYEDLKDAARRARASLPRPS